MEHPSIIKAVDVFEDKRKVKIVLELCEGGDLFDQMLKRSEKCLDESTVAWITCKIARALKYLHSHYVCHRDLKPENILFTKNGQIKITDFGLAHYLKFSPDIDVMHTCCGTPHYVAPEILGSDEYGVQVDFWSLGVILYVMLSGSQPFNSKSIHVIYDKITRGQYQFPSPRWDKISNEAISCIKGLMHIDPKQRLNCDTLCQHPFIVKYVDLKALEEEENQLLQKQYSLMQHCSLNANKEISMLNDNNNIIDNNNTNNSFCEVSAVPK
jgi:serine/threonine protein kinase